MPNSALKTSSSGVRSAIKARLASAARQACSKNSTWAPSRFFPCACIASATLLSRISVASAAARPAAPIAGPRASATPRAVMLLGPRHAYRDALRPRSRRKRAAGAQPRPPGGAARSRSVALCEKRASPRQRPLRTRASPSARHAGRGCGARRAAGRAGASRLCAGRRGARLCVAVPGRRRHGLGKRRRRRLRRRGGDAGGGGGRRRRSQGALRGAGGGAARRSGKDRPAASGAAQARAGRRTCPRRACHVTPARADQRVLFILRRWVR